MAVTADQYTQSKGGSGKLMDFPALTAKTFYGLTMAFIDAANGYATDVINAGANAFAGIVKTQVDNSGGASGDLDVECYQDGAYLLTGSGFAQTDVGVKIYATDNYVVTTTSASMTYIGTCKKFVSATQIWVEIDCQLP